MTSYNDLPPELIGQIGSHLEISDLSALRLTDRKTAEATLAPLADKFRSIIVWCSRDGLHRLKKISETPGIANRVEHVTVQASYDLGLNKDIILDSLPLDHPLLDESSGHLPGVWLGNYEAWLRAHVGIREPLIQSLNKFPKMKFLCVSSIDPRNSYRNAPRRHHEPQTVEIILSILPHLEQTNLEVELMAQPFADGGLSLDPFQLQVHHRDVCEDIQREIFGTPQLDLRPILCRSITHLELLYLNEDNQNWFYRLLGILCGEGSRLQTLKMDCQNRFDGAHDLSSPDIHLPNLTHLELTNAYMLDHGLAQFIVNHGSTLKSFVMRIWLPRDYTLPEVLHSLAQSLALEKVILDNINAHINPDWPVRPRKLVAVEWTGNDVIADRLLKLAAGLQFTPFVGDLRPSVLSPDFHRIDLIEGYPEDEWSEVSYPAGADTPEGRY